MPTIPPFASSRDLRASGSVSLVALLIPGVVRPLQLSACLEFKAAREFASKVDEPAPARRNHRGQRSQAALRRRRCRFDESNAVCHIDAGETSRVEETLEDHADARSPNGVSSAAIAEATPPAAGDRESTLRTAAASCFTFFNANVFAIRRKSVDVTKLIERRDFPTCVIFTKTWLDKALQEFPLPGYVEVSRKDRGRRAGGVIVYAKI